MATKKGSLSLSLIAAALVVAPASAARPEALRENVLSQRAQLGLDQDHDFVARVSHKDELGQTHVRFQQTYKGVKVFGGEVVAHADKAGRALASTLDHKAGISLNVNAALSAGEALAIAHQDLAPRGAYAHEPKAELVVFPETIEAVRPGARRNADGDFNGADAVRQVVRHTLAYHVNVELENGADETIHRQYLINAHTGAIIKSWDNLHTADAVGTGNSQFSGAVSIHTDSVTGGFNMVDKFRAMNISTYNLNHGTGTGTGTLYNDADNVWGDGTNYTGSTTSTTGATGQTAAVDAHYGIEMTYDYYKNIHGRNGIDNANRATYSRVHYSTSYDNAFWSDTCFCMTYGDGSSFKSLESMDVAGHEMSHGVCANSANLTYSGESGGLNEANSDIFGNMVELFSRSGMTLPATTTNTNACWTVGEDLATASFNHPLRYMYKPSLDGSSKDAWSSTLGTLDVHYSSGPANRMFFFLSQGASATSTTNYYSSYTPAGFTGIGPADAAKIWYRALTVYMTSSTNYAGARTACLSAATDLFGATSAQYAAVQNAFAAINVGTAAPGGGGGTTDTTAPTVSATESGTSGTITFSATATDNVGVTKVEFYVDGVLKGTDTTSPYSMTLDSTTLTNATHSLTAKAYDAAGNVATSTAVSFTVSNTTTPPPTGTELVVNGGFESGATSWTATSGVIGAYTPRTGVNNAYLNGYGSAHTDYIYQQIAIPTSATGTLTFWVNISTAETTTTTAYDTMKVQVLNTAGTVLATLATYSNLSKTTGYVQKTLDLSAYKGQTIRLRFYGVEDSSLQTTFKVDDISVK